MTREGEREGGREGGREGEREGGREGQSSCAEGGKIDLLITTINQTQPPPPPPRFLPKTLQKGPRGRAVVCHPQMQQT